MGYDTRKMVIEGLVSRHNAPKDEVHDALWNEAVARVREALDDRRFDPIRIDIMAQDADIVY